MKLKKGILLIALTIVAISVIGIFNNVQAATATTPITLSIKPLRSSGQGYKVVNNGEKYIWKIYNTNNNLNETFYCIKGGPGFGSSVMGSSIIPTNYTEYFDMRKPEEITSKYLAALPDTDSVDYERLMWVLDQCYVQPKTNASDDEKAIAQENKQALLDEVEKYAEKYPGVYENTSLINDKLTDNLKEDDIDAIQQLAIWYYTNDDEYHVEGNPTIKINAILNSDGNYQELDISDDEDAARMHAMDALYAYLTQTPQEAGFSYDYKNNSSTSNPVEIVETDIKIETSGNRLIIGPYKIEQLRDINYSLEATFTDGDNKEITDVQYLDNSKKPVEESTTLKDLVGDNFYISIPATTNTDNIKLSIKGNYFTTEVTYWSVENPTGTDQPVVQIEKVNKPFNDEYERVDLKFDLALRKFIYSINDVRLTGEDSREPVISDETLQSLANGGTLTTEKIHSKTPITIKTGDRIVYTIRIYNEGEVDGWATEVTDYLPEGLKFVPTSESIINTTYGWTNPSGDEKTIVTDYLASDENKLTAFDKENLELDYIDLQIECEVIAKINNSDQILKNIAEITEHKDVNGNTVDRDSEPGNVTTDPDKYNPQKPTEGIGEQDDDDFEDLILPGKYFDLALRKFITNVTNSDGTSSTVIDSREPVVDTTPLIDGTSTTAIYNHSKEPIGVSNGDIVTYTIRVYNEGTLDGYVTEITDHLPSQLEFIVDDEINAQYGWTVSSDGRTVKTDITSPTTSSSANRDTIYADRDTGDDTDKVLLKAFEGTEDSEIDYIDVQIRCRVKDNIDLYEKITNIADITEFTDSEGEKITDRDSQEDNVTLPSDETLPEYKDPEIESGMEYIPGQQDDDDFEKLVLQRFDLALRKFITGVENGETTTDITNRAPVFTIVNENEYTYEHTKEPVQVANGNIVIYTLRIFNEGNVNGYASEVKDDLPEGLEYLPDNSINTAFGWKMYTADGTETDNVSEAEYIKTDFLSKENEETEGDNLIEAFNPETMTMPDYKDLKIAFKVTEPNTSDRIIINTAEITDDSDEDGNPIDDVDSTPDNDVDGEDDIDIEKIKVLYFDLSLRKWVTESIVTYNGKTTVTKSGNKAEDDPEAPMKVEIQTANIDKTTVKFRFNIRVTNEGEIAGYATELIDYVPDGLKFIAEDNPEWEVTEDGRIVTDQLKDTLLQLGESATVEIVLAWINGKDNMGEKVNWAEISKDENEYNSPDIDSTPGNNVKGEDDIDEAPVLLSPSTGSVPTYITLSLSCVSIIAVGLILIKKFVI